tara:strand:+ start:288 stop:500 length:213 start_codon:yes stop_codon:yes gene_type:complete
MFANEKPGSNFDFDRWKVHRSSGRYARVVLGTLFGSTARRIFPTVALLLAFSCAVDYYNVMASLGDPREV